MNPDRTVPGDWYAGTVPENVTLDAEAHLESTYSFLLYRSQRPLGVRMDQGSAAYIGTMFDVGPQGQVHIGKFTLINSAWFISDSRIEIGDYTFISWSVILMDNYRASLDPRVRRQDLGHLPHRTPRRPEHNAGTRPIRVGSNVWIGFEVCVLPGTRIGDGSIIGARSVVAEDIPAYSIAAGNPARVIRQLERPSA